ncbi:MAG: hypothetical protein AAFU85_19020, partial [Planctomycetota bacterium]
MHMEAPKRKSHKRFEQLNHLVDVVLPTLDPTEQRAMFVFYRHANGKGRFRVSAKRLAETLNVTKRGAQKVFDRMETKQVIAMTEERQGTIPRQYVITGRIARDEPRDTST